MVPGRCSAVATDSAELSRIRQAGGTRGGVREVYWGHERGVDERAAVRSQGPAGAAAVRAGGRARGTVATRADRHGRGTALVRRGPPDPRGARRRLDVRRRAARPAAPVSAPPRHGRRRGPLRLPRRPVGPASADQPLPGRDVLRGGGRRRGDGGADPRDPRPRAWPCSGRATVRRLRPAPARVGPRRRGRQLPGRPHGVRQQDPRPGRDATGTSRTRRGSPRRSA